MDFLIYEGKVAAALLVFYLFYRFLLKKETFHRFNRVVLVGTAVLSFVLPLCIITIHKQVEVASVAPMSAAVPLTPESAGAETALPESGWAPVTASSAPWWPTALAILFWAGVAFVLIRVIISILSVLKIVRQGTFIREEDGCRIIVTERDIDPFSWMKYIVLSRKDWESDHAPILAHEKAHIGFRHSVELLLVDVLSAFQWFNPAIWMLRADLQELHEYEADDAVLRAGANIKEYQYLLIRKAVSKSGYSVANSFNHSILKNRITMMSKSRSPLSRGLRVLYVLPLVCLALGLQARTVYVPVNKDSEKNVIEETSTLSGTVWKGEVGKLSFSDNTFEIRTDDEMISGRYSVNDTRITFVFTNFKNLSTGKEKKGEDELTGEMDGNSITIPVENGEMVFKKVVLVSGQPAAEPVILRVKADGSVENGGKTYTIAQLKDVVKPAAQGELQTVVQISAADDVPMGVIQDVREALREIGSIRIRYSSPSDQDGETLNMPPTPSREKNGVHELWPGVKRENIFIVRINANDKIFFGDAPRQDDAEMLQVGKDFLKKRGKDARFTLQADRGTSYGAYRHMQDLLFQVFTDVREDKAQAVYGKRMKDLTPEQKSEINFMVPLAISETEMKAKKR